MNTSHIPIDSTYYFTDQDDTDATFGRRTVHNAAAQVARASQVAMTAGDMNSVSTSSDEDDEYDEDDEDDEDYVDNIIPTKSTPGYVQQFNQPIANVKQISKKEITKQTTDLVVVNSSDRENKFSTKSNDYTIKIDYKVQNIENIIGVELVEGYIKNTAYNVNHTNNILRINVNTFDLKTDTDIIENIVIPPGNYVQNSMGSVNNLDTKIKSLFDLYKEFENINIRFNTTSQRYYIYQKYSYIITEHSSLYNIFLNVGETTEEINIAANENVVPSLPSNPLFTNVTKLPKKVNIVNKVKKYTKKTIGKLMGFSPDYHSSYYEKNVTVRHFKKSAAGVDDKFFLRFDFVDTSQASELLFNKLYELFTSSEIQNDMFVGFKLDETFAWESPIRPNTTHAILKLYPGFATNIITHLSTLNTTDELFIQLTLKPEAAQATFAGSETHLQQVSTPLHQWPEWNVKIPTIASSNLIPFSTKIYMPIISDESYNIDVDEYMLMELTFGDRTISKLNSSNETINNSFAQFRTEDDNKFFKAYDNVFKYTFSSPITRVKDIKVKLKDREGTLFDLNNKDHSFILKLKHLSNPKFTLQH